MNNFNFSHFGFLEAFKSLFSTIVINILIVYSKMNKKKIIFFYHPRKLLTGIHTFYIEDLFRDYHQNFVLIYGHISQKKLGKNYFFIKEGYFRFLLNVDFFMTTVLCDKFINNSKKVYLNHHIYDSPVVNVEKEQKICEKFSSYDVIFLPSQNLIKLFKEMFARYNNSSKIKIPILKEIGYPKFDFLEKKIKKNVKGQINNILISPTGIYGYPGETYEEMKKTIDFAMNSGADSFSFAILSPLPGTPIYRKVIKENLWWNNRSMDDMSHRSSLIKVDGFAEPDEFEKFVNETNIKANLLLKDRDPKRFEYKYGANAEDHNFQRQT